MHPRVDIDVFADVGAFGVNCSDLARDEHDYLDCWPSFGQAYIRWEEFRHLSDPRQDVRMVQEESKRASTVTSRFIAMYNGRQHVPDWIQTHRTFCRRIGTWFLACTWDWLEGEGYDNVVQSLLPLLQLSTSMGERGMGYRCVRGRRGETKDSNVKRGTASRLQRCAAWVVSSARMTYKSFRALKISSISSALGTESRVPTPKGMWVEIESFPLVPSLLSAEGKIISERLTVPSLLLLRYLPYLHFRLSHEKKVDRSACSRLRTPSRGAWGG